MSTFGRVSLPDCDRKAPISDAVGAFPVAIKAFAEQHRPSRMPFFQNLAGLDHAVASDPLFLGQIQGLAGGDTHHYQLTRAFRNIGAKCVLEDEEFGDPEELCRHLDGETAQFVRLAPMLYSRSLGPWCAIEVMSVDWMRALADAVAVHFPQFIQEPYFEECFSEMVEERHAEESLAVTQMVLRARPALLSETLSNAKLMAEALDGVWTHLDRVVQSASRRLLQS
jgi:hypothetical protein